MVEVNNIVEVLSKDFQRVESSINQAKDSIDVFTKNMMQEYRNRVIDNQVKISDLILEHGDLLVDQEIKRQEAVAETTKIEEERNEVLQMTIELEEDLIEIQDERVKSTLLQSEEMKKIGRATLDAYNSISSSIIEIKRKEAEEKKALIDKELEDLIICDMRILYE